MIGNDEARSTAQNYRDFALHEAHGKSPLYEELALGVAGDGELLERLAALAPAARQPNLLLGAVRLLHGVPDGFAGFRAAALRDWDAIEAILRVRRTQTNEAGRCASLLPLLSALPQPLALLEVGASAGLCLIPDRYAYDYGGHRLGDPDSPVTLRCRPHGPVPLPEALPEVAWRAGVDVAPVDPRDETQTGWLRALVWPEQEDRAHRLDAALALAARDPVPVREADLREGLEQLAAAVPPAATLVVFHTAVLTYVPRPDRERFAEHVAALGAVWIASEGESVLAGVVADAPAARDDRPRFLVSRDREPVAWTDPHGAWLEWIQPPPR